MEHTLIRPSKRTWTCEEDDRLRTCIATYGEGQWNLIPLRAGLDRCRKSCRLRWLNYLKPDIKRGDFEKDEVDLIIRLHKLLGNRWELIPGRLLGRTGNDIKNYWNTRLKKLSSSKEITTPKITRDNIIKPQSHTLSNKFFFGSDNQNDIQIDKTSTNSLKYTLPQSSNNNERIWWEILMGDDNNDNGGDQHDKKMKESNYINIINDNEEDHHKEEMKESNNNNIINDNGGDQHMKEMEESNNINIINEICYEQDNNLWSNNDVDFWDFLDAPQDFSM